MKAGILGGTFNPVHYGHLRAAEEVREKLGFDKIIFIPSKNPPLKTKEIAEPEHRYEMSRLATSNNKFFELSDIEFRLKGKSYSVKTMEELKKSSPGTDFFFILGIDTFLDVPNWWHPERVIKLTNFVIISRPHFRFVDLKKSQYIKINKRALKELDDRKIELYTTKLTSKQDVVLLRVTELGISSTEIRELISQGKSVNYLLPAKVKSYIIANKLYKS
ncbi:MAG: nicotinate-nucleotide adenylyltransferase [Nitrospirae bacterium]|nr:nicotinate-nucleotide adenylyltransferase [Nitrospirota bacterium]